MIGAGMKRRDNKDQGTESKNGDASPIPFDDALRKILASPPMHKVATPKGKKKTGS
jgi:hypothetical protein